MLEEDLIDTFRRGGFSAILDLSRLRMQLENQALRYDTVGPMLLAEAVGYMEALHAEHDERGGVAVEFKQLLDRVIMDASALTERDGADSLKVARATRDKVRELVSGYDPKLYYA